MEHIQLGLIVNISFGLTMRKISKNTGFLLTLKYQPSVFDHFVELTLKQLKNFL